MSMLKKMIVAAALVATAAPGLASDASEDAKAARRAREQSSDARRREARGPGGKESAGRSEHAAPWIGHCDCPCATRPGPRSDPAPSPGYRSDPDPVPDYGG